MWWTSIFLTRPYFFAQVFANLITIVATTDPLPFESLHLTLLKSFEYFWCNTRQYRHIRIDLAASCHGGRELVSVLQIPEQPGSKLNGTNSMLDFALRARHVVNCYPFSYKASTLKFQSKKNKADRKLNESSENTRNQLKLQRKQCSIIYIYIYRV